MKYISHSAAMQHGLRTMKYISHSAMQHGLRTTKYISYSAMQHGLRTMKLDSPAGARITPACSRVYDAYAQGGYTAGHSLAVAAPCWGRSAP